MKFQGELKSVYDNNISAIGFQEMAIKQSTVQVSAMILSKPPGIEHPVRVCNCYLLWSLRFWYQLSNRVCLSILPGT